MLRFLTAGESHGQALVAILEGIPANLHLTHKDIDVELERRQGGYGRGERMQIESDRAKILSGVRFGKTLGSPISLLINNRDWEKWHRAMSVEGSPQDGTRVTRPRPGHADLAATIKYGHADIRNVLERASARETAARVAVGAIAKKLLREFHIDMVSHVIRIGPVAAKVSPLTFEELKDRAEASPVRCADQKAADKMIAAIDEVKESGDSLGGICEIRAAGCPVGLGSHVHWDRRMDGRICYALMSIPSVKGVEIGLGFKAATLPGSQVHDAIHHRGERFTRPTNNAGGIEGGISNGEDIVVRVAVKPIPTMGRPLLSVDVASKKQFQAFRERADVCVVPAVGIIGEAVVAFEIAKALCEKFGGDSLEEMMRNYQGYEQQVRRFSSP